MSIEIKLKNNENKGKDTYSLLSNEKINEQINQKNFGEDEINTNTNDTKKYLIKDETKLNLIEIKNEDVLKKYYVKIKLPFLSIKKVVKIFLYGCFYLLFSTSIYLYLESLAGCEKDTLDECLVDDRISNYVMAGIKLLVCCVIMAIIILIQILCKLTRINYIFIILPYLYLFHKYKGVDLKHHGTYNTLGFLIVTLIPVSTYFLFAASLSEIGVLKLRK